MLTPNAFLTRTLNAAIYFKIVSNTNSCSSVYPKTFCLHVLYIIYKLVYFLDTNFRNRLEIGQLLMTRKLFNCEPFNGLAAL